MQSKQFTSNERLAIRYLRKNKGPLDKTVFAKEISVSWPCVNNIIKGFLADKVFLETWDKKIIVPNPEYASFAGVYITDNKIELSVIDFSGKEIYYDSKNINDTFSCAEALAEILKFNFPNNILAVSICSDYYFEKTYAATGGSYNFGYAYEFNDQFIRAYVPEKVKYYAEKTCVTKTWKWYDSYDVKDTDLNVIFTFDDYYCYYTIIKNGIIIQKIRHSKFVKDAEEFLNNAIVPVCKAINPDNMVLVPSSKDFLDMIKENISEWKNKIMVKHYSNNLLYDADETSRATNYGLPFEARKETNLIVVNDIFCPVETAAIHAMYSYYGWAN